MKKKKVKKSNKKTNTNKTNINKKNINKKNINNKTNINKTNANKKTKININKTKKKPTISSSSNKNQTNIIIGLIALIIVIIVISFIIPSYNLPKAADTNQSTNSQTIDLNTNKPHDKFNINMTFEEFNKATIKLQSEINKEIINVQTNVLKTHYSELGINEDELNACLIKNDYSNKDLNINSSSILLKIQQDVTLAKMLGINGTPGIYVNGYFINGYKDYNYTKQVVDAALEDLPNEIKLNLDSNSYIIDTNQSPKLTIVFNEDHSFTKDNLDSIITTLKSGDYSEFFTSLFDSAEVNKINYKDPNAISLLETLKVPAIPLFFLEGKVEDLNIFKDDNGNTFNNLFLKIPQGGYVLRLPPTQYLNYKLIKSDDDYIIGNKDANVTMFVFTDYQCPYCKMFEEKTQKEIIKNYVDTNRINVVIKDFLVHQSTALFPAIFSRCVEDQGDYLKAHELLFSLQEDLGSYKGVVKEVMESYKDRIDNLNKVYKKLNENKQ